MSCGNGVPWEDLPESSRLTVIRLIRTLAGQGTEERFTGRITLECSEGGIRTLSESRVVHTNPDGSRRIEVHTFRPPDLERDD